METWGAGYKTPWEALGQGHILACKGELEGVKDQQAARSRSQDRLHRAGGGEAMQEHLMVINLESINLKETKNIPTSVREAAWNEKIRHHELKQVVWGPGI